MEEQNLEVLMISPDLTVLQAMDRLNQSDLGGTIFLCEQGVVKASLTDGDVRRHILSGGSLNEPVRGIANHHFLFLHEDQIAQANDIFDKAKIRSLPVLDKQGHLVNVITAGQKIAQKKPALHIPVVIMAGGKGTRLKPYTNVLPKPLIPIGDYTITEHIMNRFLEYDCRDFTMIVNHKKNMIKAYFADLDKDHHPAFVDEEKPLGTGGGLKMLEGHLNETFFLTNCDILVDAEYDKILRHHQENQNIATLVCVTKKVEIPYGVVEVGSDGLVDSMTEKPCFSFLTNTGMYVLEPEIFDFIPQNTFIHITQVLENCRQAGKRVGVFPVSEQQWSDMGQIDEMKKMCRTLGIEE